MVCDLKYSALTFSNHIAFSSVQFSSVAQSCLTLCDSMDCSTPGLPVYHQLPESTQTHVHRVADHPTITSSEVPFWLLLSVFPSIRIFSNEPIVHIKWPKYWSFSFSLHPTNEYSRVIYFRIDCLDLLAVQGTLKSLLQNSSSKASILWCSAFFIVQLPHQYMTTGKTIALNRETFVGIGNHENRNISNPKFRSTRSKGPTKFNCV